MTIEQRLINLFMEEYYPNLVVHFGNKDFLHSAYVTVFESPCPVGTRRDTFEHRVSNAFYRHKRKEFSRAMHFIVPDPVFWLLQGEQLADEPQHEEGRSVEEEEHELRHVKSFLRTMFSSRELLIFELATEKGYSFKEIAEITGLTQSRVDELLGKMNEAILNDYHKPQRKKKNSK